MIINDPNARLKNYYYIKEKRILENGTHNTICKNCEENCHINCLDTRILNIDIFKYFCFCFDKLGYCKVCQNKCYITEHEFVDMNVVMKKYLMN